MRIQRINQQLEQDFRDFMVCRGYTELEGVPISSKVDPSVRLVGSAFSRLRSILVSNTFPTFTIQRAVRTQLLNSYYEESAEREFCSYHVSYGAIVDVGNIQKLTADCLDLVTDILDFSPDKLRIRASSKDSVFLGALHNSKLSQCLILDSEDDEKYNHLYGGTLLGRGIKIDYRQKDKYKNIAHVVAIYDMQKDGLCIGAEMALTNASVLLRRYGLSYAVDVMPIAELLPTSTFAHRRYADSIMVVTHLLYEGVRPNSSRMDGRLLKRYLKALHNHGETLGICEKERIKHITDYAQLEYQVDSLLEEDLSSIINRF